jgi:hypothetical protein
VLSLCVFLKRASSNQFIFDGQRPYYIDKLSDFIEEKVLTEEEKVLIKLFYMAETFQ